MSSESRPLLPKKTVPSPLSSLRVSHTTSKPTPHSPSTTHAASMLVSLPSQVALRARATTPPRNTSTGSDALFKVPALPMRLMTPSTSTVAHSSSPRRTALSSSPPRETAQSTQTVQLTPGLTLVFGRHRHRHHAPGSTAKPSSASATKLTSSVPRHLLHLLSDTSSSRPAEIVHLPRTASHASRVHATVEYIAAKDSLRIVVIGQNGLRVKRAGVGSRRLKSGQRMDLAREDGASIVQIDFYGCKVDITFPRVVEEEHDTLFSPISSPISAPPSPATSMPPSSPPVMPPSSPTPDDHSSPLPSNLEAQDHARSVKQELLNAAIGSHDDLVVATPTEAFSRTLKTASRPTTPAPQPREPAPPALSVPLAPLPDGVDLAAILASTVVFSGSSKLSLPDLVKHMLETQPSLREHGDEQRWTDWARREVEGNAMFGKVERHGKDASGHPLLPHYFYNPAHDPDTNRAKQLGGLVRPLRAAQRAGGKAIDWRPVGGGRRR